MSEENRETLADQIGRVADALEAFSNEYRDATEEE